MSITGQCRKALQNLVFGDTFLPQAFTIGLAESQEEIAVWLHGMGAPIDVTHRHSMACADPFTVCIAFDEEPGLNESELGRLSLEFCQRDGEKQLLGQINLGRKRAAAIPAKGSQLLLFEARSSANYCLPKLRIWAHYLRHRYSLLRKVDSAGIKMSFLERRAVMVMFIRPHPVVLVSLNTDAGGNIFPMNIMGDLDNGYFAFALKNSRLAARLVERSTRVALSNVPLSQTSLAYRLGVNHGKQFINWNELPFATKLSTKFGIRVPLFAQRVRELEVEAIRDLGSHTFFVARIVHDEKFTEGVRLCIVHGFYQAWRLKGRREELKASLVEDSFLTNGELLIVPYLFRELNPMPVTSTPRQESTPSTLAAWMKPTLWLIMAAMTTFVIFYSEIPLLRQAKERAYLSTIPWLIIPHAIAGIIALLSGPLQFSSRFRRRNPKFHRILGRIYVGSVFIAAPLAIVLSSHRHDPRAFYFVAAIIVQAGTWFLVTAAAFLTARNRHFQQHREWMVRSYAVTFTFIGTRVLQPIPAWNRHGEAGFALEIVVITFMAILIPDLAFHWRQLIARHQ